RAGRRLALRGQRRPGDVARLSGAQLERAVGPDGDAALLEETARGALEGLLAEARRALDDLGRRAIAEADAGPREGRGDALGVGRDLLVREAAQRQLDLPVGQHVRDAEAGRLAAAEAVRLVLGDEPEEAALDDHEHADARLLAPRL